ncbi:HK97 family phage major capsid protein [Antricoccus suffuscus]|uniref:HK97 family phage major capsid protein n=1 Tax=Antricoccus suffuscus TaxID=1629062 RepID=A0A2T0ZZZ0_9ACTN|nr:phage major capsid protein [Antricoccus suffuscus]PRZ41910.1 HK97 family phage major capsid protein [Antricoccus suffuscus]
MAIYAANVPDSVKPDEYHDLILEGLQTESIAAASGVAVVNTSAATLNIPRITADTTAVWALEGEDLEVGNPALDEIASTPKKVGGVIKVSRELAQDSSPAATKLVGDSLTRSVAVALDKAYFTNSGAQIAKAPKGLPGVTGALTVASDAADLDAFTEAQVKVLGARAQVTAWYMNAATYLRFAGIKQADASNVGLLETQFAINGVPVHVTEDLADDVVYGADTSKALLIIRDRAKVEVSNEAYFSTDEVAVKVTMRADLAFPSPKSIVKITVAPAA